MEDYEAQEQEFWRKLEEGEMSRSPDAQAERRRGCGPDRSRQPGAAFASRGAAGAAPPLKGSSISIKELVAEAKKEGHLNTIALPPDWANYGEMMSTFQKKYGIGITNDNPNGSSAAGEPGHRLAEGRLARSRRRRRRRLVRRPRCGAGPVRASTSCPPSRRSRAR